MSRVCACGVCGRSLEGRRAGTLYFDGACRVRAFRALQRQGQQNPSTDPVVTLRAATDTLRTAA